MKIFSCSLALVIIGLVLMTSALKSSQAADSVQANPAIMAAEMASKAASKAAQAAQEAGKAIEQAAQAVQQIPVAGDQANQVDHEITEDQQEV